MAWNFFAIPVWNHPPVSELLVSGSRVRQDARGQGLGGACCAPAREGRGAREGQPASAPTTALKPSSILTMPQCASLDLRFYFSS